MRVLPIASLQDQACVKGFLTYGEGYLKSPCFINDEDSISEMITALGEMEAFEGRASLISIYKKFKYRKWTLSQKCILIRALGQAGGEEVQKILLEMSEKEHNPVLKEEIALFLRK